jgi:hypothetical protein
VCEYVALEPMIGDLPYELGFTVREKGRAISCVVFTQQWTGDPITQYVPMGMAGAVKSLKPNDQIRVWGKLVSSSSSHNGIPHLRRARPFFVVRNIERL